MHVYDTLLIGSSYASFGYALARKNCLIAEEHHLCDTHFYLPFKSFAYTAYEPKSEDGKRLLSVFSSLSLFQNGMQNTNAFEIAFCKYVMQKKQALLLGCRVIRFGKEKNLYRITLQTNEGLSTVYAQNVLDTRGSEEKKSMTVLFQSENIDKDSALLTRAFPDSAIESAFYEKRYAIHIPFPSTADENSAKLRIRNVWRTLESDSKIVCIAPVFSKEDGGKTLCDDHYKNPIEAFEAGYVYAKKGVDQL